ncbi:MAG: hypothetical protein CM15mV43_370 [uncultured marine virus]|nr:MAG: hypothetical protein CM15mV43_370 [uncultured marine virus]
MPVKPIINTADIIVENGVSFKSTVNNAANGERMSKLLMVTDSRAIS